MYKTVLLEDLKKLDNLLKSIFDKIADFPIGNIKKNTRNSWSIEEHLYHCYLVEKLSLSYIQKKTLNPQKLISPSLTPYFKLYLLKFILFFKVKLKAPEVVSSFPELIDIDQLHIEWTAVRISLNQTIQSLPDVTLRKGIFKHPLLGRLSMRLTLKFFIFHLNHHLITVHNILNVSLK